MRKRHFCIQGHQPRGLACRKCKSVSDGNGSECVNSLSHTSTIRQKYIVKRDNCGIRKCNSNKRAEIHRVVISYTTINGREQ